MTNEELAAVRVTEMEQAERILGISEVEHLGYPDGKLNTMPEAPFVEGIVKFIDRHQPSVVVSFPADGGNRHPDHMAISAMTTAAVLSERCSSVQKMYYVMSETLAADGHKPSLVIDTEAGWPVKAAALKAHHSQIYAINRYFGLLQEFPENRRYEAFVLAWERGKLWPAVRTEQSVFDGLL